MILDELNSLQEALASYSKNQTIREHGKKTMLFGAKFADEISKAQNEQQLSQIMVEANRMAYLAGVPELSGQINNLGRLQSVLISDKKKDMLSTELANMYDAAYGDLPALINDEVKTLRERPEWQQIANAPVELRADMYQIAAKRFAAQVKGVVEKLGDQSYGYREYALDPLTGDYKLTRHLKPIAGGYDNILTKEIEMLQAPFDVSQMELKDADEKERFDYQLKRMDAYETRRQARADRKATDDLMEYYTDPNKWKILENKYQTDLFNAAQTYYEGAIDNRMQWLMSRLADDYEKSQVFKEFSKAKDKSSLENLNKKMAEQGMLQDYEEDLKEGKWAPYDPVGEIKREVDEAQSALELERQKREYYLDPKAYMGKIKKKKDEYEEWDLIFNRKGVTPLNPKPFDLKTILR